MALPSQGSVDCLRPIYGTTVVVQLCCVHIEVGESERAKLPRPGNGQRLPTPMSDYETLHT